jgi:DNA-binding transcriptional ArsR family regulator
MNSPHRHKRMKGINGSQAKLPAYLTNIKQKHLTSTRKSILELSKEGMYPAQIARHLGISPSAVSQQITKLAELGYIDKPVKQESTRGGYAHPLDVRWRSLKWNLAKPVELKHDEQRFLSGVLLSTWRVKEATITTNYGKKRYSMEITCGLTEGDTIDEVCRRHDEKCLAVFRWVAEHFPELKQVTNEYAYTINRMGEVNIKPLKPLAEEYIQKHGRLRVGAYKVDDSLKNGGELQGILKDMVMKSDFASLRAEIRDFKEQMIATLKEQNEFIRSMLPKPEPKAPTRPYDDDMYR